MTANSRIRVTIDGTTFDCPSCPGGGSGGGRALYADANNIGRIAGACRVQRVGDRFPCGCEDSP